MNNWQKKTGMIAGFILTIIIVVAAIRNLDSRRQDALTSEDSVKQICTEVRESENEEVPSSVQEEISELQNEEPFATESKESPKPVNEENWMQEIQKGNFSCLKDENSASYMEDIFGSLGTADRTEWVRYDIDRDGVDELIWQEKELAGGSGFKRIMAIYSHHNEEVKCFLWDINDCSEYFFLGESGKLVYYMFEYGVTDSQDYAHCVIDMENGIKYDYWLSIYNVYDTSELYDSWGEKHPDMMEVGMYYRKRIPGPNQSEEQQYLTREQFLAEFYELTGVEYGERGDEFSSAK